MLAVDNAIRYRPSLLEKPLTLTLLIDLDDTLLGNSMETFIPAYLSALGERLADHSPPEKTAQTLMIATRQMFDNNCPAQTLEAAFDPHFYPTLGIEKPEIKGDLEHFYGEIFPTLEHLTQPIPEAVEFIEQAIQRGYRIGIATNPLFPRAAILHRLEWAGLSPKKYSFDLIPAYEDFHFAKPNPAFFAEFLGRMGWPEGPVLMIGNDLDHDVRGAQGMGIPVFWISDGSVGLSQGILPPNKQGSISDILPWIDSIPNDELVPEYSSRNAIAATLRGCAAALNSMANAFPIQLWNECPEPEEWCLTAIFCHLRDVEREVNLPRLQAIKTQENPFIIGIDTDAWADERNYKDQNGYAAQQDFIKTRSQTLKLLDQLSDDEWQRPAQHAIFGPTNMQEIVSIIAGHDRLHTCQVYETINTIRQSVEPSSESG